MGLRSSGSEVMRSSKKRLASSASMTLLLIPGRSYRGYPFSIWKDADVKRLGNHSVGGINQKQECAIPVIIGKIDVGLIDEENQTEKTNIHAYLALTDEIPLIIGFKDMLSSFRICFDYKKDAAWIE